MLAGNVFFFNLWQSTKAEYSAYAGGVVAVAERALEDKAKVEAERDANLQKVKDHEKNLPAIRDGAVAAFLASRRVLRPSAGGSPAAGSAEGQQANDGAGKEFVPGDISNFIEDAADDADKIAQWQEWAIRNNIPLE